MKLPRILVTLVAVFASSLLFFAVFLASAIRKRSIWLGLLAAAAAASSLGLLSVISDYFRTSRGDGEDFFSMDQMIDDFFEPADGGEDAAS